MFNRVVLHYQQWKRWEKRNLNSRFHKILVLLGLKRSPTFEHMKAGEKLVANLESIFGKISKTLDDIESDQ